MVCTAGAVAWVRGLTERVQEPWGKLQGMQQLLDSPEGKAVAATYASLIAAMQQYEQIIIKDWCEKVRAQLLAQQPPPLGRTERRHAV